MFGLCVCVVVFFVCVFFFFVFFFLFFVVVFSCSGSFLNMYDFKDQIKDTRIRQ